MRLPEIADRLRVLAYEHDLPELIDLAEAMRRRKKVTNAPVASVRITDDLRRQIRAYHRLYPDATQHQIALHFNVNNGRVSETLAGFRF
jgi:hypothetical protein